jgi:hypothetical protein
MRNTQRAGSSADLSLPGLLRSDEFGNAIHEAGRCCDCLLDSVDGTTASGPASQSATVFSAVQILIWDGAPYHRAEAVRAAATDHSEEKLRFSK